MAIAPDIDALWDYQNPEATAKKFLEALPHSPNLNYKAELLTQLARTYGLRKRFEEAHQTLDEVEKIEDLSPRVRVRLWLERGRTFRSSGKPDQAKPLFEQAWELGKAEGESILATDAAHMLALVEEGEKALEWNRLALEYAQQHPEASQRWAGSLLNNIGWSLSGLGRFAEALETFQQAWDFYRAAQKPWETHVAAWTVAHTLRSLERHHEALEILQALSQEDGYVLEEIGENLLALGKTEEAKPHFAKAHQLLSQDTWLAQNEAARLERLEQLGR